MAERPEDLNLPNAVVTRIMKEALPEGVNVSKDARLAISKAASIFVLYATSCANNFAMSHKRKTISGQDVLESMADMEFEHFVEPLEACLQAYKEQQQGKKEASEKKKKAKEEGKEESGNKDDEDKEEEEETVVESNNGEEEEDKEEDDQAEDAEEDGEEEGS